MTSAQAVETSVTNNNSLSLDSKRLDSAQLCHSWVQTFFNLGRKYWDFGLRIISHPYPATAAGQSEIWALLRLQTADLETLRATPLRWCRLCCLTVTYALSVFLSLGSCRKRTVSRHCCVFPFIYKGRRYRSCTKKNSRRFWCAKTSNYDRDRKWGYCSSKSSFFWAISTPDPVVDA